MTTDDIRILETSRRVSFPDRYVDLLLNFPRPLNAAGEFSAQAINETTRYALIVDPARLLELNELVGNPTQAEWLPSGEKWPEYLFVIGEDGGGDYFLLDTRSLEAPVLRYTH